MTPTLRTPAEWSEEMGITILDPDGWRGQHGKAFDEAIDKGEYMLRMSFSTVTTGGPWVNQ